MAAAQQPSYAYTRPSVTATRSLIDSSRPSPQESGQATPSDPISPHGTLHRRKTNNYETALADRLTQGLDAVSTGADGRGETAGELEGQQHPHRDHHHGQKHHAHEQQQQQQPQRGSGDEASPSVPPTLAYRGDAAAAKLVHPATEAVSPATARAQQDAEEAAGAQGKGGPKEGDRPLLGLLGRQQSFKQSDQKRVAMERMLSSEHDVAHRRAGYSSSQPATPV